ncbi:proteasome (prosome, macropain) assembly chaperone 4 [Nesidiocoris tenuis]|nr:proteasome (prosome, macropain) assembly chaperone 4 [Nesidiocoris tenuis]
MNASVYIWVGTASDSLDNMCLSMPSRFDAVPLASPWFGETDAALPVAQKLSQVLGKPVLLSLGVVDYRAVPHVERAIVEDIRANPDQY